MFEFVLTIIPKDFTFLVIFTSPKGNTIDFLFMILRSSNLLSFNEASEKMIQSCSNIVSELSGNEIIIQRRANTIFNVPIGTKISSIVDSQSIKELDVNEVNKIGRAHV